MTWLDEHGRLVCWICDRTLEGDDGLAEAQNLLAHLAEQHDTHLGLESALLLRAQLQRRAVERVER